MEMTAAIFWPGWGVRKSSGRTENGGTGLSSRKAQQPLTAYTLGWSSICGQYGGLSGEEKYKTYIPTANYPGERLYDDDETSLAFFTRPSAAAWMYWWQIAPGRL